VGRDRASMFALFSINSSPTLPLFRTGRVYNTSSNKLTLDEEYSMIDFTSRQLRAFLLVAQYRNFTRAAGALFVTPSGVSVLIRELELQLGVRLFERTTRHVALTNTGKELLAVAQRNLQGAVYCPVQCRASSNGSRLVLITGRAADMVNVLAQAIKKFRSHRPELRFQLFDGDTPTVMQKVESGALDMGLGVFFRHLPGIRRRPLFRFSLMAICADNGHAPHGITTTWPALKGEKLISLQASAPLQQLVAKHLAQAGVLQEPGLVVNHLSTQIAMVEAEEGIAVVPSFALPECQNREVVMSRLINPVVHLDFYQIRHAGRKLPPVAEEFTSFLQGHIATWAGRSGVL